MGIEKRYVKGEHYDFNKIKNKIYLGDKNKICRFCKKSEPDVRFKTIAHSIPEQLGNKFLISNYECDECNQKFGKLENDLGIFLGPIKAIYGIKGKKKNSSKFKINGFCIENKENTIKFTDVCDESKNIESSVRVNSEEKTIDFKIDRNGFIPSNVYKSFVKMALSIVPDEILQRLDVYLKFLNGKLEYIPNSEVREIFIPEMNENKTLVVYTLINNQSTVSFDGSILPLVIFSVRIKGFEYQLNLYENNYFGKQYNSIKINPMLDSYQRFMKINCEEELHDLSSNQKAKSQFNMSFSYEYMEYVNDEAGEESKE